VNVADYVLERVLDVLDDRFDALDVHDDIVEFLTFG